MEDGFLIKYFLESTLLIVLGLMIKLYLKKTKIGDWKRVLSVGVFWLNVTGNVLIIIGAFCLLVLLITFYFYLKSENHL